MANPRRTRGRTNPLDVTDEVYGRNPRDLSSAVRRSVERTGAQMPGGTGQLPPDRAQRSARKAEARVQHEEMSAATPNPRKRREFSTRVGRKGGPGKRRQTPKHAGPHR